MDILQRKKNPWIGTLVNCFPSGIPKQSFAQLLSVNPSDGLCIVNDGACVIDAIVEPDCLESAGIPFSDMEGFVVKLTEFTISVIGTGSMLRLGLRVTKMDVQSAVNLNAVGPSKTIYSSPVHKQIISDYIPSSLRAPSHLTQLALHVTTPSVATVPASWLPKGVQLPVITGCISAACCVIPPQSARLLNAIWRNDAAAAAPPLSSLIWQYVACDRQTIPTFAVFLTPPPMSSGRRLPPTQLFLRQAARSLSPGPLNLCCPTNLIQNLWRSLRPTPLVLFPLSLASPWCPCALPLSRTGSFPPCHSPSPILRARCR